MLTTLRGYHLFMQRPTFLRLKGLPLERLVAELRRPEIKAAILAETDVRDERPGSMENALPPFFRNALHRTFPMGDPIDYEPLPSDSIAQRARPPAGPARRSCTTRCSVTAAGRWPWCSAPTTWTATSTSPRRCCWTPTPCRACPTPAPT
ncbi:MAG: hypothetical protein R2749_26460 [Acidimicrobiales bacterium]